MNIFLSIKRIAGRSRARRSGSRGLSIYARNRKNDLLSCEIKNRKYFVVSRSVGANGCSPYHDWPAIRTRVQPDVPTPVWANDTICRGVWPYTPTRTRPELAGSYGRPHPCPGNRIDLYRRTAVHPNHERLDSHRRPDRFVGAYGHTPLP